MYFLPALCFLLSSCHDEETAVNLQPVPTVEVVIPFRFSSPELATDDNGSVSRSTVAAPVTHALTGFSNTWILVFDADGTCLSSANVGTVSPDSSIAASLPTRNDMTLYILANGPDVLSMPATLADFEGEGYFSTAVYTNADEVPYIGKASGVNVNEDGRLFNDDGTDVQVFLKRMAAQLSITCTLGVKDYTITSVRLHNAPAKMYYAYSGTAAEVSAVPLDAAIVSGDTYTWFTGENLRGIAGTANQNERYAANVPASSTFIRITLSSTIGAETMTYDIYPGKNLTDNYDLARNWDYVYTTTFDKSASELASEARVTVTDIPIDLTTEPSNCYILAPGNSYKFDPRIKGEGQEVTGGTDIPVHHAVDAVKLIWQDEQSLVQSIALSSDHDIVVVRLTPALEGNAVVAAYSGGRVVWSWHLWVRSKVINRYSTNRVSGMSCVLGSLNKDNSDFGGPTSMGLLYQWGRNIPFPRASLVNADTPEPVYDIDNNPVSFDVIAGPQSISSVIEHPTTFYSGNAWHTDGDDLWGKNSGQKTIFDPSPRGWKIPQDNTMWSNWVADPSSGEDFTWVAEKYARLAHDNRVERAYYPACGFYTNLPAGNQPVLTNVGFEGRYWTAIFEADKGGILRFTADISGSTVDNNLVVRTMINQTYACSVRPVLIK